MSNWGGANRPIASNKLGEPNIRDGIDGDIQVRQSSLGAKLFAKIGGRWFDTPLSKEGITKIGANISNYLSIDNDSVDVFKNDAKVASFGETLVIGKVADDSSRLEVDSSGNIKIINRQGTTDSTKVAIDNDGSATFTGNIVVGGTTVTSLANGATANSTDAHLLALTNATGTLAANNTQNLENLNGAITASQVNCTNIGLSGKIILTSVGTRNICIGVNNTDAGDDNISIGSLAGEDNGANSARNVFIGTNAGLENVDSRDNVGIGTNALRDVKGISSDPYNGETVAIGAYAGEKMDRGYGNVLVGYASGRNLESSNSAGAYQNTFIGSSAGASDTTTSQSVYIGVSADGSSNSTQNEIVIGANADGQGANYAVIGNGSISRLYANEDGDGVLYANGTIVSSDRRVKDNIEDIDLGLNFINKISPIKYTKRQLKDYDQSLKEKLNWYN